MDLTTQNSSTPNKGKKRGPKPRVLSKTPPTYTPEQIEGFADDLIVMAEKGEIQIFEDFYKKHRLHRAIWKEWKGKYPYVNWAHNIAKEAMASTGYVKFVDCPTRGALLMKTQHGWSDIEEIADNIHKVASFQELKARINGEV